ncbi:MAG TPA: oligosaccharide flippase family protein [Gaiellaceae bacterium]|nr:oligosaccharide flippase family protein [Gaiellaceae bacterium]
MTNVARASVFVFLGKLGGNLGYFAAVLVLARALGPADRGAIAYFTTVALMAAILSAGGLREAASVFVAREPESRSAIVTNTLLAGFVLASLAAVVVCGILLALPGLHPASLAHRDVLLIGAGIYAASLLNLGYSLSLGLSLFRQQAILQPLYVWTYAAALVIAWLAWGLSVTSAAVIWTGGQLLGGILMTVLALRRMPPGRLDVALQRRTWKFGVRAWVGSLSTFLNFRIDQVIMGAISSNASLGVYAVAVNASEVELYVPQSVSNSLIPIIASTSEDERAMRTLRAFRLVFLLTAIGAAVAMIVGPFVLPLVFGDSFRPSVTPFLWLVPGGIGFVASSVFSAGLAASASPGRSSVGPFVSLVVGFVLDFALIPSHGAAGAAAAATAAFLTGGVAAAVVFARTYDMTWRMFVPRREDAAGLVAALHRGRA